jgi:hypothetical protein
VVLALVIYVLTLALVFPSLIKLLSWCVGLKVKMKAPLFPCINTCYREKTGKRQFFNLLFLHLVKVLLFIRCWCTSILDLYNNKRLFFKAEILAGQCIVSYICYLIFFNLTTINFMKKKLHFLYANWSIILLIILYSCNNGDTSSDVARQDSLKKVFADSTANVKKLDTLKKFGILTLDTTNLSCDSIAKLLTSFGQVDPEQYIYLFTQAQNCNARVYNKNNPDSAKVVVAYEDPKENKILFNTISLKIGEDIAAAAKKIITIAVALETNGDPESVAIANIAGGYTVDAYLEAAKNNNPLIIIMPTAIPNVQLAKDGYRLTEAAYKQSTKLKLDLPITIQVNAAKAVFSLSQKAADFAEKQGVKTINVGPIKVPVPNINPLPESTKPKDVVKKLLCPIC